MANLTSIPNPPSTEDPAQPVAESDANRSAESKHDDVAKEAARSLWHAGGGSALDLEHEPQPDRHDDDPDASPTPK